MIFAPFSDNFKCFHTADMFAALVRLFDRVTSLFGTIYSVFPFIRQNTERAHLAFFSRTILVAEHLVHP